MKCPTCGNDNPADAQFCGGCGTSLSAGKASGIETASSESLQTTCPVCGKDIEPNKPFCVHCGKQFAPTVNPSERSGCDKFGGISIGLAYVELGQYQEAIDHFDKALAVDQAYPGAISGKEEATKILKSSVQ